jgi:hypothetical protein
LGSDTRGAGFIEYLALVGAIALFALVGFQQLGRSMSRKATDQAARITSLDAPGSEASAEQTTIPANTTTPAPRGDGKVVEVRDSERSGHGADTASPLPNEDFAFGIPGAGIVGILLAGGVLLLFYVRSRGHLRPGDDPPSDKQQAAGGANLELAANGCATQDEAVVPSSR